MVVQFQSKVRFRIGQGVSFSQSFDQALLPILTNQSPLRKNKSCFDAVIQRHKSRWSSEGNLEEIHSFHLLTPPYKFDVILEQIIDGASYQCKTLNSNPIVHANWNECSCSRPWLVSETETELVLDYRARKRTRWMSRDEWLLRWVDGSLDRYRRAKGVQHLYARIDQ